MKTTAFLTLTGTGAVLHDWMSSLTITGAVTAPEFALLAVAVSGLGLQTLLSEYRFAGTRAPTRKSIAVETRSGA